MNQRTIAIASVLMAAALTGIYATSPPAYADESKTSTDQETKQKNVGSGEAEQNNCAENQIESDTNNSCRDNNQPSSPPVDMTVTETATETDITTNPLFNLADLFDVSTGSAQ